MLCGGDMAQPIDGRKRLTPAEYVAMEQASPQKREYLRGRVYAMAGATPEHNAVCGNLIRALGERLRGRRCVVLPSDQHVYVEATDLGTYPDVTVLCAKGEYHRDFPRSLVNPSLLVEVLSPSTEAYDRGAKFDHYRHLESLKEYVLVSTDEHAVDHFMREPDGTWRLTTARGMGDSVRLPSLDVSVPLAEIYENLDLVAREGAREESPHPPPAGAASRG
jgi:Uma2 family endonuclease